jgi:MFS family permease
MYLTLRDRPAPKPAARSNRPRVAGTVVLLGIVSMFTDVSSESVNAVLPIYLTTILGMSALAYGFVDGIYQGISAVVRVLGGWVSDRSDHPKWVALAGYTMSAASRVFLLPAASFAAISAVITVDRLGKGVRTAPRDALIGASTSAGALGRAFGVHRALDTFGALLGPLLAFGILLVLPEGYRAVFIASLAFAVIGVAVLLLLVPDQRPRRQSQTRQSDDPMTGERRLGRVSLRHLRTPGLGRLLVASAILGILAIGDGFLYLALTERDSLATKYFPLLYIATNFAYLCLAVPLGRLADRVGRARVFVAGHIALLLCYLCAGGPFAGPIATVACLLLLGAYYAATDGVLAAISARIVDESVRASGIATAQTVVAAARFAASLGFGLMWTVLGLGEALLTVSLLLAIAIPVAALLLRGVDPASPRLERS